MIRWRRPARITVAMALQHRWASAIWRAYESDEAGNMKVAQPGLW
jgi:hypothetical protein